MAATTAAGRGRSISPRPTRAYASEHRHVGARRRPRGPSPAISASSGVGRAPVPASGGRHLYYRDNNPRRNSKWDEFGCRGEVRSGNGYLVLWHDGAERLAEELQANRPGGRFPADLFEAVGVTLPTLYAPRERGPAVTAPGAVVLPMLEVVQKVTAMTHCSIRSDIGRTRRNGATTWSGGPIESAPMPRRVIGASRTRSPSMSTAETRSGASRGTSRHGHGAAAVRSIIRQRRSGERRSSKREAGDARTQTVI